MKSLLLMIGFVCVAIFALSGTADAQTRSSKTVVGRIAEFECGDNCYLTVIDDRGKRHHALCAAPTCSEWNENTVMPARFKGRRVKVTVGRGTRYDGGGNVVDRYPAFTTITFLKR